MSDDFDFSQFSFGPTLSFDTAVAERVAPPAPMARTAGMVRTGSVRIASVADLAPFVRVSADTLVHKATQDLWQLCQDGQGNFFAKRLFDEAEGPLKV